MGLQAYLDYWDRAIRKAWDGTCSSFKIKREDLLRNFIIFVIALLLLPKHGGAKEVIGELRWALVIIQAGIGTFALTFLVNLLRAPAQMEHDLIESHEAKKQDFLSEINGLRAQVIDKQIVSATGVIVAEGGNKTACIRVTNHGDAPIRNCTGYLIAVFKDINGRLAEDETRPPVYLQWSSRHGGGRGIRELTFLREADLDVVRMIGDSLVFLAAYDTYGELIEEQPSYIFDVEIAAENCVPVRHKYRLTINPIGLETMQDRFGAIISRNLPDAQFTIEQPIPDMEDLQN